MGGLVNKELKKKIKKALQNDVMRGALDRFQDAYPGARAAAYGDMDFEQLRDRICETKSRTVHNIEAIADRFEEEAVKRGTKVFRAATGQDVVNYVINLAKQKDITYVAKAKSMLSEEIHLNHHLEAVGIQAKETDLGELIIQLDGQKPSHMVLPAIHLSRHEVAKIFDKYLHTEADPEDITEMVKIARRHLRESYMRAGMGITGANYGVAENGSIGLFTNEGNARLTASIPPVHVVLIGYEKLIETMGDAVAIAQVLPRNATGQLITTYHSIISGPTTTVVWENDEPKIVEKELHIILVDNGRLAMAKDPMFGQVYNCVRCAACLNVCPTYKEVGGHVYGHIYAGGIGILLHAFFDDIETADTFSDMCVTCRRCIDFCPGRIPIPDLVVELRARVAQKHGLPLSVKGISAVLTNKTLFHGGLRLGAIGQKLVQDGDLIKDIPFAPEEMLKYRSLPAIADKPFRDIACSYKSPLANPQAKAAFFAGCSIDWMYPQVAQATVQVLEKMNIEAVFPEKQMCCGTPLLMMGDVEGAKKLAKHNITVFEQVDADIIVGACPTCVHTLADGFAHILRDEPDWLARAEKMGSKLREITSLAAQHLERAGRLIPSPEVENPIKVTYHDSCHLKRSCGVFTEPRAIINALPGHRLVEMKEADVCCGMAGSFGAKYTDVSGRILEKKMQNTEHTAAQVLAVGCPTCMMQLKGGCDKRGNGISVKHVVELMADYDFNEKAEQ